jgi:starvation-inducible DNA-binding protein
MTTLKHGLDAQTTQKLATSLRLLLADEIVLQAKTRAFHWNVKGMSFSSLHPFFGDQYDALDTQIDDIAERIRQLGSEAPNNLAGLLQITRLKENDSEKNAAEMVRELADDHATLIRQLRLDIPEAGSAGDDGTADFLTGLLESHEKMAWMLNSHLS